VKNNALMFSGHFRGKGSSVFRNKFKPFTEERKIQLQSEPYISV